MKKIFMIISAAAVAVCSLFMNVYTKEPKENTEQAEITLTPVFGYAEGMGAPTYVVCSFEQDENAVTYYTFDGSSPNKKNGYVYEKPFAVTNYSTVLKYRTYKSGCSASDIASVDLSAYLIDESRIVQNDWDYSKWTAKQYRSVEKAYQKALDRVKGADKKYLKIVRNDYNITPNKAEYQYFAEQANKADISGSALYNPFYYDTYWYNNPYYWEQLLSAVTENLFLPAKWNKIPYITYFDEVEYSRTGSFWEDVVMASAFAELYNLPPEIFEIRSLTPEIAYVYEDGCNMAEHPYFNLRGSESKLGKVYTAMLEITNTLNGDKRIAAYRYEYQSAGNIPYEDVAG